MKWFKHDTDASMDPRVKKLIFKHGPVGYAIYFHCLELIANSVTDKNITFELQHDSEIIADNLKVKGTSHQSACEVVEDVMRFIIDVGLFDESNDRIFCFKLMKRLDSSMTSNKQMRKLIVDANKSHDSIMINHDSIMPEEKRRDQTRSEEREQPAQDQVRLSSLLDIHFPKSTIHQKELCLLWEKTGKTIDQFKAALEKTSGSRGSTRWGWIVDEMNKDFNTSISTDYDLKD